MNLRNVGQFNIGLDIGTGSVGWAVTNAAGELLYFNGKPTWGSRIFPSASTAAETRIHRGQRRRYARRRWRLDLLQELFAPALTGVDPDFFIRLNQSRLMSEDRAEGHSDYTWTFFNGSDFTDRDYFKRFPTIYHLRKWLMETNEQADIRLIYLAFHNIVKHRGNFLRQDNPGLTSKNADVDASVKEFCDLLQEYCDNLDIPCAASANEKEIAEVLRNVSASKSQVRDAIKPLLAIGPCDILDKTKANKMGKALAAALIGLKTELADVFFLSDDKPGGVVTNIYLSSDEGIEVFKEVCPDEASPLFEAMQKVYSAYVLQEILSSKPKESLSANKVADYEQYRHDLRLLKDLVRQYAPDSYDEFFRGPFYASTELHPQKHVYDKGKAKGYTKYNEVHGRDSYDAFKKEVKNLFGNTKAVEDPRYLDMMERFENEHFLRRLKTSDNGAIPFQLHLEEMRAIIDNQAQFYPFLKEEQKKLESLVTFRIPYYVGPLTRKNAPHDASGKLRFAWAKRREGQDNAPIKPWNWERVIDKDRSATEFIQRMTGTCTYLQGEPVLPKCSLLYEEYCVLNELNGAKFSEDGDEERRFDYKDRMEMIEDLFRKGKVSYKKAADWMRKHNHMNVHVSGGQGESGFESKLGSYIFFSKDVFRVDEIPEEDYPMIEEIILWSTVFEDREIFKDKLKRNYGDRLTDEQIKKIVRKRFSGWGRLSRKLLTEIKVDSDNGPVAIMDVLREGNPNHSGRVLGKPMVFMEVLRDDDLGFQELVDEINREYMLGATALALEDLPGSPALRRGVNQALAIVEEIVHIAGHAPENIFIEVTREDDAKKRGQRTKRRYDALREAMAALKEEAPEFWDSNVADELTGSASNNRELDERLTLYFMQGGKSLYSGKPLDIGQLSSGTYHVDHIIPQAYVKDDSFENKALVFASENEAKSDQMLIDADIRKKMRSYWDALKQAGLIGEKKYRNLLRSSIGEKQMRGFIARQLVETSQIVKTVQTVLRDRYAYTNVMPVKASLSSELRERAGLVKCREANDFHHAHDAFLAVEIGRFIQKRHSGVYDNPIGYAHVMKEYVKKQSSQMRKGKLPGSSTFIISSFMTSGFDEETGELFKDDWSASEELAKIKRYFDYRQCYISRMPEEDTGAFWTDTVYSPRGGKKAASIPLKQGLDIEKYGGYSSNEYAYFILIDGTKKNGKPKRLFEGVPIPIAQTIQRGELSIEQYADVIARENGLSDYSLPRKRILKYTKALCDGDEFYLATYDVVYSARQLYLPHEEYFVASDICDIENVNDAAISEKDVLKLYTTLVEKCDVLCSRFDNVKKALEKHACEFSSLSMGDKRKLIKNLLLFFKGVTKKVDLSLIGGPPHAGGVKNGLLRNADVAIELIDQSITGMFEKRTHIGL